MKQSDLRKIITEEVEGMLNMLGTAMAEGKGQDLADKYVAKLRSEFRKLNDDELDEFRKTIAQAFDLKESVNEAKVNYNFSEDELKRVLKLLGRNASTEVKMIKAFEKAFGRKLTRDEMFESVSEGPGQKHYTKDGKEWTGPTHKMPDGTLMTQDPHNDDSEKLFHKADLDEALGSWTSTLDDLIAFGFGNLAVKFKGRDLGKVKDFKKLGSSVGPSITIRTFNYLLKKGGLKHNHNRNRAELGSKSSKYTKGSVELTEGINLKASHLSSKDYQKAKKLKAFDSTDWVWNPKSNLYDKVNESVNEGLSVKSWHEETRPNKIIVKASNGKTLEITPKSNYKEKSYQAWLQGLDQYKTNPKAASQIDKALTQMANESVLMEYSDQELLKQLMKARAIAAGNKQPGLVSGLQKHISKLQKKMKKAKTNEAEFKHISRDEHKIKLAIKDVEKKSRLKANRDKAPEYEQEALNKIMLSKVLGREKLSSKYKAAWEKLKKEYSLKESKTMKKNNPLNEAKKEPIVDLLKQGGWATVGMDEKKLVKLSDAFDDIGDEQADRIASPLNMAIELKQDGYGKSAVQHMNKFNKACQKELKLMKKQGLAESVKISKSKVIETISKMSSNPDEVLEGLWDNIRKKKARGESPAKPGDDDYPDSKAWDQATEESVDEGLWDNIRKKKARGGKTAKPGDKDYPDDKAWDDAQESVNEDELTEIRKGDYVGSGTEVGLVNKVSGSGDRAVAYVKFDSRPKSFHPILARNLTKTGKKHKGKDLYQEGKVNEAVKPVKLSGNLGKDLKTVTAMAEKMVKYAKDNFNTYIPTGEKLSQLKLGGTKEKDVLKYNINHLAKAINTDLKKKYMKDFMGESVNEGSRKKVTKSMWQKMSDDEKENALLTVFEDPDTAQKWIERKWNSLPGSVARDMYTESVNEASSLFKKFDDLMNLRMKSMDVEQTIMDREKELKQLYMDMEQEAEPEGGPKASAYGKRIESLTKILNKDKAILSYILRKIDKLDQY